MSRIDPREPSSMSFGEYASGLCAGTLRVASCMLSTRWRNVGWQGGTSMAAQRNKALVRRFLEAHAKGELDTVDEMLAPDFVDHNLIPGQ